MGDSYDVIVIGLGGVGSAAIWQLAAEGYRVLGIDRYAPPHPRGSSHGQTRIIRKAYFEHPDYVPLLLRAYQLWHQLQTDAARQLYFPTGLLQVGPATGEVLTGVRRSAAAYDLPIAILTMADASALPGISGQADWQAVFEVDAGYLLVEQCVEAHLQLARQRGAAWLTGQTVRGWSADGHAVQVTTDQQTYRAAAVILAAGPWAGEALQSYRLPLKILRKHMYWYPAPASYQSARGFPCFFFDAPAGYFYGFPDQAGQGLKVARPSGGAALPRVDGAEHPEDVQDRLAVEEFLKNCLPSVRRAAAGWQGCYYTMTPDQHFIVDRLPDASSVVVVAGLSGHGFKFTSVLGQVAARLATDRAPEVPIEFLSLRRFDQSSTAS